MSALHGIPRASSNGVGDGSVMTLNTSGESYVGEVIRGGRMSAIDTKRTMQTGRPMSAFGVKRTCHGVAGCRLMTQSGHEPACHVGASANEEVAA